MAPLFWLDPTGALDITTQHYRFTLWNPQPTRNFLNSHSAQCHHVKTVCSQNYSFTLFNSWNSVPIGCWLDSFILTTPLYLITFTISTELKYYYLWHNLCIFFFYLCSFVWKDIFLNWLAPPVKVDNSSHIPRFCPKLGQFVRLELMTADVRTQQWLSISGPANNRKLVIKHFSHVSSPSLINSNI